MQRFDSRRLLTLAILVAILLVSAWLRLSHLDIALFEHDEAEWSSLALRIARGQEFPLIGVRSLVWVATGPAFLYVLALPMLVSTDPSVVTGFVGLLNILGVALTFAFVRRYYGLIAAGLSSLLYATNPWAVYHSRKVWNPDVIPLFGVIFFWSLFLVVVEKKPRFLWLAAASAAVALQLNQSAFVFPLILGAVVLFYWRRLGLGNVAMALLVAVAVSAPYLYYEATHGWVDVLQALRVSSQDVSVDLLAARHALSLTAGWLFPDDVLGVWARPGEVVPEGTASDVAETALFFLGTAAVLARLMWGVRRSSRDRLVADALLLAWFFVPVLAMTRHGFQLHQRYLLLTHPSPFIIIGVGLATIAGAVLRYRPLPAVGRPAVVAVAVVPVLLLGAAQFGQYTTILDMIDRNGLEQSYGIPVRYYREAFANAVALSSEFPGEPMYVWSSDRAAETVRYMAAINDLQIRQASESDQVLLGPETGRDRLYLVISGDKGFAERLIGLGFERIEGRTVEVLGGQTAFTFYRLPAGTRTKIEAVLANEGPALRFANGLLLRRWDADAAGGNLELTLAWEAWTDADVSGPDPQYCLSQHARDTDGNDLAVRDITLEQMSFLRKGDLLLSWSDLPVPDAVVRQQAWVDLGMFHCWQRDTAAVVDGSGRPVDDPLRIGPLRVGAPATPGDVRPTKAADVRLGQQISLLGYDLPAEASPGGALAATLYWQASGDVGADYTVFLQLLRDGQLAAQQDNPPRRGKYPTSLWEPGEVVVDGYDVTVPADAPPGQYRLIAGMYTPEDVRRLPVQRADGQTLGDYVELGTVTIR